MKGIVFNLLEEVVVRNYGEDRWDHILEASTLYGAYTSLGSYPDVHMSTMVQVAAQQLELTPFEVLRWFGREAIPCLVQRYPDFFTAHSTTLPFVLSVNSIIHPEVRKIYPGAQVPTFGFTEDLEGRLLMGYRSPRRLCALAQGFTEGAALHYHEAVQFEHIECMLKGDDQCLCRMTFLQAGSA